MASRAYLRNVNGEIFNITFLCTPIDLYSDDLVESIEHDYIRSKKAQSYKQCQGRHQSKTQEVPGSIPTGDNSFCIIFFCSFLHNPLFIASNYQKTSVNGL